MGEDLWLRRYQQNQKDMRTFWQMSASTHTKATKAMHRTSKEEEMKGESC